MRRRAVIPIPARVRIHFYRWRYLAALALVVGCAREARVPWDPTVPFDGGLFMQGGFRAVLPGDTLHLRLQTTAPLTWTSDVPAIASVSATGIVTGHSVGLASITARTAGGYSAFAFVGVYPSRCAAALTVGTIGADTSVSGGLGPGSCGIFQASPGFDHGTAEGWRLELATAQTIRIDLDPEWRCSHLRITDPTMGIIVAHDNHCTGNDQTITLGFEPGVHLIWVATTNTAGEGGYAAYTLALTSVIP